MDYSNHLTREEVRALTGLSDRTLQRLAVKGKLKPKILERPGMQSIAIYSGAQIERLCQTMGIPVEKLSSAPASSETSKTLVPAKDAGASEPKKPKPPISPTSVLRHKHYLTFREAHALNGLPQTLLRQCIKEKVLRSVRVGSTVYVWRKDLEDLTPYRINGEYDSATRKLSTRHDSNSHDKDATQTKTPEEL